MTDTTIVASTTTIAPLFDVTETGLGVEHPIERVALEHISLADNPRRNIDPDGINRLAGMLMRAGQLVPAIGRRLDEDNVVLYAGQRRLLAARKSADLAGSEGYEGLSPIASLVVILLDHEPSTAEIRRIQAQENQREDLSPVDAQDQFADCWADRVGLKEEDRIAAVCADLGITAKAAHNLRRQLTLPEEIRTRVAVRPGDGHITVTMANRLAEMHEVSPPLSEAVAQRISSADLHERALADMGAFVHRATLEDPELYAVRLDEGALLDGAELIERSRSHLDDRARGQVAQILGCDTGDVETHLDGLASAAKNLRIQIRVDRHMRERAANGRYAWVFARGADFADSMWLIDPVFMIDVVHSALSELDGDAPDERDESYFGAAENKDAAEVAAAERNEAKAAQALAAQATRSNLGLGADIAAGVLELTRDQQAALRDLVCGLLARSYPDVIAYGAGWTDRDRQQPLANEHFEPRSPQVICDTELQRALEDPEPLRGIAQLATRMLAGHMLDPAGVTRTKALGRERMAGKLQAALPGGEGPLREAAWKLMAPMLSPRLRELHRDSFVSGPDESTVDLAAHRASSDLSDLDLGDDETEVA